MKLSDLSGGYEVVSKPEETTPRPKEVKDDGFLSDSPTLKKIAEFTGVLGLGKGLTQAIFFNFTQEGKDLRKMLAEGKISPDDFDKAIGGLSTNKEVIGGAVGAATTILGAGKPATSMLGRLGTGAGIGAGYGLSSGLQQNLDTAGIAGSTVTGAAVGTATSGLFELVGAGLRALSGSKYIQRRTGFTYNKELQPPQKEIAQDIERGFKTFGEQVANVVDTSGKPVYVGTYQTLLSKAKTQVAQKGKELIGSIRTWDKANPGTTITRDKLSSGIVKAMEDNYGALSPEQLKKIDFEVSRLPKVMSLEMVEDAKRLLDNLIPDSFWSKIDDPALSFPSLVRYTLRDNARKIINDVTGDGIIQQLNNEMGLAMDMRKMAANQIAKRSLSKVSEAGGVATTRFPLSYYFAKLFDDVIFNPAITTRSAQGLRNLGAKTGQTVPRTLFRQGLIRSQEESMNQ